MKKLIFLFLCVIVVFSITSFAFGDARNFIAHLSGEQTPARGHAVFMLDEDGLEMSCKIVVADIENILMAHIHMAPPGHDGPPVVWLYPGAPPAMLIPGASNGILAEGVITEANLIGNLAGQTLSGLLDIIKAGEAYVNVHTEQNPGGEIRGQVMGSASVMFNTAL